MPIWTTCKKCHGSGNVSRSKSFYLICDECRGKGMVGGNYSTRNDDREAKVGWLIENRHLWSHYFNLTRGQQVGLEDSLRKKLHDAGFKDIGDYWRDRDINSLIVSARNLIREHWDDTLKELSDGQENAQTQA